MQVHQGVRFECDLCGVSYTYPRHLRDHFRRVHQNYEYDREKYEGVLAKTRVGRKPKSETKKPIAERALPLPDDDYFDVTGHNVSQDEEDVEDVMAYVHEHDDDDDDDYMPNNDYSAPLVQQRQRPQSQSTVAFTSPKPTPSKSHKRKRSPEVVIAGLSFFRF